MKEYKSEWGYKVIKSFRKTMSLQVKDWQLIVKAPFFVTKRILEDFIGKHKKWIEKRMERVEKSLIDIDKIDVYKKEAKKYIPLRVDEFALKYSLKYNSVKITSTRTRWWSCTSRRTLNFTYRLILLPKEVVDYIIIHELAHLKEMNHSRAFWNEVEKMMPNYKEHEMWLKKNGYLYSIV